MLVQFIVDQRINSSVLVRKMLKELIDELSRMQLHIKEKKESKEWDLGVSTQDIRV
jgi:hypothetical protein